MNEILINVVLTVASVALLMLIKVIIEKGKEISKNLENERARIAIEKVLEIVTLAVNTTNQKFVKELKDNDKFDKKNAEAAFNTTKAEILEMLDDKTKEILEEEFSNTDQFLNSAIESKVWEEKNR